MLPIRPEYAVTLVEGWTPLCAAGDGLLVKDEARNPTGSFKARGMTLAVSVARALGARALAAPSAGNAAGALAAYGAAAGLPVVVAMPEDSSAARTLHLSSCSSRRGRPCGRALRGRRGAARRGAGRRGCGGGGVPAS